MNISIHIVFMILILHGFCRAQHHVDFEKMQPVDVVRVEGRQGVAVHNNEFIVSGTKALYKYDKNWNLVVMNDSPFELIKDSLNHIGDIDIYNNKIYAGCEYFKNGRGFNIRIVVYDAETLLPVEVIVVDTASGQEEVSGVAVDGVNGLLWLSNWANGSFIYKYSLGDGSFLERISLNPSIDYQQGILYAGGKVYVSADDGDAEKYEHDNLYIVDPSGTNLNEVNTHHIREFTEFKRPGEIEGLSYDGSSKTFYVLMNRGARIINGIPRGFYDGYTAEVHEVYIYQIK